MDADRPAAYDAVADVYALWTASAPVTRANGPFYVDELVAATGPAVELGIGDGRIGVEAARRGKAVIGVDGSTAMLERCGERAAAAGVTGRLTLLHADFRAFELPEPAALVVIPFHSIGHMPTLGDKRACLAHVRAQLAPGGRLVFDHFVPDLARARASDGRPALRSVHRDEASGRETVVWAVSTYAFDAQLITIRIVTEELDPTGVCERRRHRLLHLSWLEVDQSRALLEETGFEIEASYGDFDRTPLGPDSTHQIWSARRP